MMPLKKKIFTISGLHGTGKTSVGKRLAELLSIRYYSTGKAFRELAKEFNLSLEDFTKYVEQNPQIDKILDQKIINIASEGNILIDSQLGGKILENTAEFSILLTCPLEIRVKRMAERDNSSYEEKLKETIFRERSEFQRFKSLYNIDLKDKKQVNKIYDLIIDTQNLTIEEVVKKIISVIEKKCIKVS
jgi:cytidylate kinase